MHLKTLKYLQQTSKLSKLRAYFHKRSKKFTKCACQKVFSKLVNWFFLNVKKEKNEQNFFFKLKIKLKKKEYFSYLNKQISKLNLSF